MQGWIAAVLQGAATEEDRALCLLFTATASSGASAGVTAWGGVEREREGWQVAAEIRGCCRFPPSHSLCPAVPGSCEDLFG